MPIDPSRLTDAFLHDLALALRTENDFSSSWLDLETLEIHAGCPASEFDSDEPVEHTTDSERALHEQTVRWREDTTGRYVRVPWQPTTGRLHRFAQGIEEEKVRNAVFGAMRGGGGAYRRVRDALHRMGLQQLWYDFEAIEDRALAREWLASVDKQSAVSDELSA